MVGLSPHTIRAWERRHGAVVPVRTSSGQRRYSLADVETLKRIKDVASARGLSLRLAVIEAVGEAPLLGTFVDSMDLDPNTELEDAGPWRAVADLDSRLLALLDQKGRIIDCNVAFARLAGALRFELTGHRFSELVEAYDRAKAVAIYRGTPQRRQGWELNLQTPATAGLFSFDCVPVAHRGGWLIALVGQGVD
jgi:PAS domain-containing protein